MKQTTLFLSLILIILIGCSQTPTQEATPVKQEPLPNYQQGYFYHNCGTETCTLTVVLSVDKNLTRYEAQKLVNYYKERYPDSGVVDIGMVCNPKYSALPITKASSGQSNWEEIDKDYVEHTLYNYYTDFFGKNEYFDSVGDATQISFKMGDAIYGAKC